MATLTGRMAEQEVVNSHRHRLPTQGGRSRRTVGVGGGLLGVERRDGLDAAGLARTDQPACTQADLRLLTLLALACHQIQTTDGLNLAPFSHWINRASR